jgi:hypothetical protein
VKVFILGSLQGFESRVVDDQEVHRRQLGKVAVQCGVGPGGVQLGEHLGGGGEEDIVPGVDGAMCQSLSDMAFALM